MKKISLDRKFYFFIDIVVIIFCALGVYQIIEKADLTQGENKIIEVQPSQSGIVVDSVLQGGLGYLTAGDTIISINGYNFHSGEEVELYLDGKRIGDIVNIEFLQNSKIVTQKVTLVN